MTLWDCIKTKSDLQRGLGSILNKNCSWSNCNVAIQNKSDCDFRKVALSQSYSFVSKTVKLQTKTLGVLRVWSDPCSAWQHQALRPKSRHQEGNMKTNVPNSCSMIADTLARGRYARTRKSFTWKLRTTHWRLQLNEFYQTSMDRCCFISKVWERMYFPLVYY